MSCLFFRFSLLVQYICPCDLPSRLGVKFFSLFLPFFFFGFFLLTLWRNRILKKRSCLGHWQGITDPVETHTISVKNESQRSKDNQDESSAGGQVRTLAQEIDVERQIVQEYQREMSPSFLSALFHIECLRYTHYVRRDAI